jgi:formate hydrogenlyase transcriptional activator
MRNPSDNWEELKEKVQGLGDTSVHKAHYRSLEQRLAELEQLSQEEKRSQTYLVEAQELSHTGSFGWKVSPEEHIWSEETYRIFEFDPAVKPTLKQILERIHPEDRTFVRLTLERASDSSQNFNYEHRLLMPDGRIKHLHVLAQAMRDSTGSLEFAGAIMDISEARRMETRVRQSEYYLSEGQRLAHMGSWSFTPDGICDYWSPEEFSILGFDPANGVPTIPEYLTAIHPDDREFMTRYIENMIAEGRGCDVKYRTIHPVRGLRIMRSVGDAVIENGKAVRFIGTTWDITESERMTEELERSKAYLAEAQTLSHTGSFGWKISTAEHIWSEETYCIFEFDSAVQPTIEQIIERTHPEDRTLVMQDVERLSASAEDFDLERRLLMPDGRVKYLHVLAKAMRDASGGIEFVGAVMDMTAAKQAEESLRQSEADLRQILDVSPQHVAVLGPDRTRLYLNQAVLDYLGLTLAEGLKCDTSSLFHPDDREQVDLAVQSGFSTGSEIEFEARMPRHDGVYRWFLLRYRPLHDDHGRITRWVVVSFDIEERKQTEERLQHENVALREEIDKASMFEEIVGSSAALRAVLTRVAKVAPTDSTTLIAGETGTGKELIARAIHKHSRRSARAFVSVNCAAIPRDLIASELFGHEKGAFTGATQRHLGRFELAEGGTIFLDEVAELPAETQVALLRVLQEREFERVGGERRILANVRVIAATNRDLVAAVSAGDFRSDLFYRLNVFPIKVPPLRDRREDIPLLVEYFIDRFARKAGKSFRQVNKRSLELLQSYPWPGNIRELQNIVERSVIVCDSETFSVDESWLSSETSAQAPANKVALSEMLAMQEKETIEAALRECGGRVSGPSGAAARLGMPRSTLESRIRSLKIDKNRLKTS